jgi:hypothetical protein
LALIPAWIAHRKGQGFSTFYVFGLLLWIVAVPVALLVKDRRSRCPECAEIVKPEAKKCPHCHSEIEGRLVVPKPIGTSPQS